MQHSEAIMERSQAILECLGVATIDEGLAVLRQRVKEGEENGVCSSTRSKN